jgi:serine/threonine protein kinase
LLSGRTFGDYLLGDVLGVGNFGVVFEAVKPATGARVAVKVLPPTTGPDDVIDFESEGELLRKLNKSSGVISYIDGGVTSIMMTAGAGVEVPVPVRYHVLSLASGSLEEFTADLTVLERLDWAERIRLWRGAVRGVHQMHLRGVAHRDLKSSNCLMVVRGSVTEIRLGDLGRARDWTSLPRHSALEYLKGRGDLRYAPPEFLWLQGGSTADDFKRADYYGLGSLLSELTSGHPMTLLAIGDIRTMLEEGKADYLAGHYRELSSLRPLYDRAISELVENMPRVIRPDARELFTALCDPEPSVRIPDYYRGRFRNTEKLEWVMRRADIMEHRLALNAREELRILRRAQRRSA